MILPLHKRKRKISFFDLESRFIPALEFIEDLIDSKLKYVLDITNHVEIVNKFTSLFKKEDICPELFCLTSKSENEIRDYLNPFRPVSTNQISKEIYKISFDNQSSCDFCSFCSSEDFVFYGYPIKNDLTKNKIKNSVYNTDVPINYNKLILGPLEDTTKEDLFYLLNEIDEIVSLRTTTNKKYFTFSFLDADLNKSFVDNIARERKENDNLPEARYCYQDCIILKFNSPYFPIVCSLKKTKIVLLLNLNPESDISDLIRDHCKEVKEFKIVKYNIFDKFDAIKFKSKNDKIFIECDSIESAEIVYYNLGGLNVNGSILITSFYPEYNYFIGEFE
jgi:hypothetical protein